MLDSNGSGMASEESFQNGHTTPSVGIMVDRQYVVWNSFKEVGAIKELVQDIANFFDFREKHAQTF